MRPNDAHKLTKQIYRSVCRSLRDFTKSEQRKELKMSGSAQEKANDRRIGALVRDIRLAAGISQQELANAVGITHQQLSKHEGGLNRIGAGRMKLIADFLCVPVSTFFETAESVKGHNLEQVEKCRKEAEDLFGQIMALEVKERLSNGNADHSDCYAQIRQKLQNLSNAFSGIQEGN